MISFYIMMISVKSLISFCRSMPLYVISYRLLNIIYPHDSFNPVLILDVLCDFIFVTKFYHVNSSKPKPLVFCTVHLPSICSLTWYKPSKYILPKLLWTYPNSLCICILIKKVYSIEMLVVDFSINKHILFNLFLSILCYRLAF